MPLQQAVVQARFHLLQSKTSGIEIKDLITIEQLFGSLNDLPHAYTYYHTRRLLLILLSLRTLVPHWEVIRPHDQSFQQHLFNLARIVLRSTPIKKQRRMIENTWDWCRQPQPNVPFLETIQLSVYSLLKVVSAIAEPYVDYAYQPDVHGSAALISVGQAFSVFPRSQAQQVSIFWDHWLVSTVPAAWFPIPSDKVREEASLTPPTPTDGMLNSEL